MNFIEFKEQSALMQAIIRGNADEVRSLIYRRCDVNEQDVEKRTPLHLAAFMGNVEITILLILNGARVNCKDSQWLTPIHRACRSSHEEVLEVLLKNQGNANSRDRNWQTPLHLASSANSVKCVDLLLPHISNIDITDRSGRSSLHHAAFNGHNDTAHLLLEKGANINLMDKNGRRAIHWACYNGHVEVVKSLIALDAELLCSDKMGFTPLHAASSNGKVEVVRLLMEYGVNADATTADGSTNLNLACLSGHEAVCSELISFKVDVRACDFKGMTALHCATLCSDGQECMMLLLKEDVHVDARDCEGKTPLHIATALGHFDKAALLIQHGADVNSCDDNGSSLLHTAAAFDQSHLIRLLVQQGADVTRKGFKGMTALHTATYNGNNRCFGALVTALRKSKEGVDELEDDEDEDGGGGGDCGGDGSVNDDGDATEDNGGGDGCQTIEVENKETGSEVFRQNKKNKRRNKKNKNRGNKNKNNELPKRLNEIKKEDEENEDKTFFGNKENKINTSGITKRRKNCTKNVDTCKDEENAKLGFEETDDCQRSLLHFAAAFKNANILNFLLERNLNVNILDQYNRTPLHYASIMSSYPCVLKLISSGAKMDVVDTSGCSALHYAAAFDEDGSIVSLLLNQQMDSSTHDHLSYSPTHYAALLGNKTSLDLLLEMNAQEINKKSHFQNLSPLHLAAFGNHIEPLETIMNFIVNIDMQDPLGRSALHIAASRGYEGCCEALMRNGASNRLPQLSDHDTPIHLAAWRGHARCLRELIKDDDNIDCFNSQQRTPLMVTCALGHREATNVLLEAGGDVSLVDVHARNSVHHSVANENEAILETLMSGERGKRLINVRDVHGFTPTHLACILNLPGILSILMEAGADVDLEDNKGFTALHWASYHGSEGCLERLLGLCTSSTTPTPRPPFSYPPSEHRAFIGHPFSPLHCAALGGHMACIEMLLEQYGEGCDIINDVRDHVGRSCLHAAVIGGHLDLVAMLLNRGANINLTDKNLQNCLMLAVIEGKDDITNYLLSSNKNAQEGTYQDFDTDLERIDLKSVDKNGDSVLHMACRKGRSEVAVKVLHLIHDASFIDLANKQHKTALHYAAEKGMTQVVATLLRFNANILLPDNKHQLPARCCFKDADVAASFGLLLQQMSTRPDFLNYFNPPAASDSSEGRQDYMQSSDSEFY